MLCHVYELRHEISEFMEKKGAEIPEFADPIWTYDFAFIVDIMEHFNLNVQL